MAWDPKTYLKFSGERVRTALDLLARIDVDQPRAVVDLGCAAGNVTKVLVERWPNTAVPGIDSSPETLKRARQQYSRAL